MTVALQIRDVPDDIRDTLAAQASSRGQSLQAFLLGLVTQEARATRISEMFDHTVGLRTDLGDWDPVGLIREGRDQGFEIDRPAA